MLCLEIAEFSGDGFMLEEQKQNIRLKFKLNDDDEEDERLGLPIYILIAVMVRPKRKTHNHVCEHFDHPLCHAESASLVQHVFLETCIKWHTFD